MRFGIYGSCVSRDIISEQRTPDATISYYIARSTIRSSLAPPSAELVSRFSQETGANFEDRSFLLDVRKNIFRKIEDASADAVLVDLIDERHATWSDGTHILSDSKGLKSALGEVKGWERKSAASNHRETLRHVEDWALKLKSALPDTPIILHRALWAKNTNAPADQVIKNNRFLNSAYDIIENAIDGVFSVMVDGADILADDEHIWGEAPYHYVSSYYDEIWRQIKGIGIDR